jgi:hypothetical protein
MNIIKQLMQCWREWSEGGTIMQSNLSMLQDRIFGWLCFLAFLSAVWYVWDLIRMAEIIWG